MRNQLLSFGLTLGMLFSASPFVFSADLETIERRGYLIVGVKDNVRPLGFVDEAGALAGFEIDIAMRLAESILGDPTAVRYRPVANVDRIPAVLNDEVDFTIAGMVITPMRERVVSFSVPYYLSGTGFVTNRDRINSLSDLQGQAIAVLAGSDGILSIQYTLPQATLVGASSYQEALNIIEAGRVSAVAGDITVLTGWVQENPTYRMLPTVLTGEPLAIVFPKGHQYDSLRRLINGSLTDWHEDGWLEERATYWGLP